MNSSRTTNISRVVATQSSPNSSTTTFQSSAKVFLSNLQVLGFDEPIHCKGTQVKLNEKVFLHGADNTKAFQTISYFLFRRLDKNKTKILFKYCWPVNSLEKSRLYMKLALGWLQELKKYDTVLKNITLRKSNFDNCRGEIMNDIFMAFSTHVLQQVNIQKGSAVKPLNELNKAALEQELQNLAIQLTKKESRLNSAEKTWSEEAQAITSGLSTANTTNTVLKEQKKRTEPEALTQLVSQALPHLRKTAELIKDKEFEEVERRIREECERKEREETERQAAKEHQKEAERKAKLERKEKVQRVALEEYDRLKKEELLARKEAEHWEREREEDERRKRQAMEVAEAERKRQFLKAEEREKKRQEAEEIKAAEIKKRQLLEWEDMKRQEAENKERTRQAELERSNLQKEATEYSSEKSKLLTQPSSKALISAIINYNPMETRKRLLEILNRPVQVNPLNILPPLPRFVELEIEKTEAIAPSEQNSISSPNPSLKSTPVAVSSYESNHAANSLRQSKLAAASSPKQSSIITNGNLFTGQITSTSTTTGKGIKRSIGSSLRDNASQEDIAPPRSPKRQAISPAQPYRLLVSPKTRLTPHTDASIPLLYYSPPRSYLNDIQLSSDEILPPPKIIKPAYLRSPRRATPYRDSSVVASSPIRTISSNMPTSFSSPGLSTPSHFGLKVTYSPNRSSSPKRTIVLSPPRRPLNRTAAAYNDEDDEDLLLEGLQSVRPIEFEERPISYDSTETPARYGNQTQYSDAFDLYKYTPMK